MCCVFGSAHVSKKWVAVTNLLTIGTISVWFSSRVSRWVDQEKPWPKWNHPRWRGRLQCLTWHPGAGKNYRAKGFLGQSFSCPNRRPKAHASVPAVFSTRSTRSPTLVSLTWDLPCNTPHDLEVICIDIYIIYILYIVSSFTSMEGQTNDKWCPSWVMLYLYKLLRWLLN